MALKEGTSKKVAVSVQYAPQRTPYTELELVVYADLKVHSTMKADVDSLLNSLRVQLRCKGYELVVLEDVPS